MLKAKEEIYLTSKEAASRLHIKPATLIRWAKNEKLTTVKTLGGHRRYPLSEINRLWQKMINDGNHVKES